MEENIEMPTTKSLAIKWGLILAVLSIVVFLSTALTGSQGESWASWLGVVPTVVIFVMAHKEFKDSGNGYMSFGQGIGIGTLTSLVSSVISSLFTFVYVKFVDTTYFEVIMDKQIADMQAGGMSDREIEASMAFMEGIMRPIPMLIMGIVLGVFFGFIIALIVTAFTKKNNPELDF